MYKYVITLTNGTVLVATSTYSQIYTAKHELDEMGMFLHIGNVIVRKGHIQSIVENFVEVKIDE